ncbi:hypothetical protein [Brevibacillus reuszeri]|uniref:hypothetical protein n=1 Tax=Brevibacillus TaxID=55080 RepID=UPI000CCC040C|nr:hypothetical protein [Brevibacillus reuszeri]
MTDVLFYGILIILALGILSFLFKALLGWFSMIFDFLFGLVRFVWWVVTLPFRLIGAIFRLFRKKPTASRERDLT